MVSTLETVDETILPLLLQHVPLNRIFCQTWVWKLESLNMSKEYTYTLLESHKKTHLLNCFNALSDSDVENKNTIWNFLKIYWFKNQKAFKSTALTIESRECKLYFFTSFELVLCSKYSNALAVLSDKKNMFWAGTGFI